MPLIHSFTAKKALTALTAVLAFTAPAATHSEIFPPNTRYEVCFTPGGNCTALIVNALNQAKSTINLQAYSFTSRPIAGAIADAQRRGIHVEVILDKSQSRQNKYSSAKYLAHQQVPVWIDYEPAIAHNKVIIIDNNVVVTGSFNFTKAAQEANAENVLIIYDKTLAAAYNKNFESRKNVSERMLSRARSHKNNNFAEIYRRTLVVLSNQR